MCKDNNIPEPEFIFENFFTVVFKRIIIKDGIKDGINGFLLTDNQKKIIENIKKTPSISAEELSKLIGITKRNIENNISVLKKKGLLKRLGSRKKGYWELSDEL